MIPTYLQGKSAAQIVDELRRETWEKHSKLNSSKVAHEYAIILENLLLHAVSDALKNAQEVKELQEEGCYNAMPRAIAFLNMVLPKEGG